MKAVDVYKLTYEQHSHNLSNKVISIWLFKEESTFCQVQELIEILNYLVNAGAIVNVYIDNAERNIFPQKASINYLDDKLDCLTRSETLLIYGKFLNYGTPNESKIVQKMETGSIIDLGCNFQIRSFMKYNINYISF
ncbi:MAG: hypothetical protein ACXVPU_05055 [Bacteroidia bacterium]